MALIKIIDKLFNQRKPVEVEGAISGDVALTDGDLTLGRNLEVDGKVKLNGAEDLTDKEGNPLISGSSGGTQLYKHYLTFSGSDVIATLTTIDNFQYTKETLFDSIKNGKLISSYYISNQVGYYTMCFLNILDEYEFILGFCYINVNEQAKCEVLNLFSKDVTDVVTEL